MYFIVKHTIYYYNLQKEIANLNKYESTGQLTLTVNLPEVNDKDKISDVLAREILGKGLVLEYKAKADIEKKQSVIHLNYKDPLSDNIDEINIIGLNQSNLNATLLKIKTMSADIKLNKEKYQTLLNEVSQDPELQILKDVFNISSTIEKINSSTYVSSITVTMNRPLSISQEKILME